ncbi:hypothetical protein [Streptomyces sp. NRRL S-1868]|uniref:hypothetical protein n=1 Tax=Streptomyces sp. NRRL S-1868 TaxID=1463892 RepID=UPI0004C7C840|nr:hypothetical protein [Streptomyces sp. NRRL S-1868]
MKTLALGRWVVELHCRVIHIYRHPDPNCRNCRGEGAYEALTGWALKDGDVYDLCDCWNPDRGLRIPLAPRNRRQTEVPF